MDIISSLSPKLPNEIITEIFIRLPVKSIAKFKCVSKPMCKFLSDPRFIKYHLNQVISKNPNLSLKNNYDLFLTNQDEGWHRVRKVVIPFSRPLQGTPHAFNMMFTSGTANGLFCMSDKICDEIIYLYNPTTGVYRLLPSPQLNIPTGDIRVFTCLGFGCNPCDGDYKVVRCLHHFYKPFDNKSYQCLSHIYSLKTNQWKEIGLIPWQVIRGKYGVWLENDILVWTACRGTNIRDQRVILAFSMGTEEFLEIPHPNPILARKMDNDVGMLSGFLSVFYQAMNDHCEIWAMMDFPKKESWTKTYVIRRPEIVSTFYFKLVPLRILTTGEILIDVDGGNVIVVYNPQSSGFRAVNLHGAPSTFTVTPYVETLISPFIG